MTLALDEARRRSRVIEIVRSINIAVVVFLVFYLAVGLLQPTYLEPAGIMNFLRRAAPLAILASGELFVLVSGGFDLSVGSLVTLTVVGGSMLTANDPSKTWWAIALLYAIGFVVGLINGAVVAYLRTPSIIATLGTLLSVNGAAMMWCGGAPRGYLPDNFRMFGRFVFHDVPLIKIFPLAIVVLAAICGLAYWGLHGTVFGRRVFAVGDNARAAELAGVQVEYVRLGVFVISALAAVTAGVMLGGIRRRLNRRWPRARIAGHRGLCRRRRSADGGTRNAGRRRRRGAHADGALHAAHPAWAASAAQGDGARDHLDCRGCVRRLAPAPRRIAGALRAP